MSRILNRQRQLAEQGRLRLGFSTASSNGKTRPVKSQTWVISSHSKDYVEAAAALWGGTVERWQPLGNGAEQWRVITEADAIDAILPPGEPLTQAYETWSKGGCQRRCDGVTEQFSGNPCLCLAQFGPDWHEQPKGRVCDSKSRLKVILPDMPGMGSWRMETGSYYATDEIAGMVDVIRGTVGDQPLIPIRLRIEPRTRVADGQTKQFIVPVLELRGVTAGELLAGTFRGIASVESAKQQRAIGSAPAAPIPDYLALAREAGDLQAVREIYSLANNAGHLTDQIRDELIRIGQAFNPQPAETTMTADEAWQLILTETGKRGMELQDVFDDFPRVCGGVSAETADAADMQVYLEHLKSVPA